MLMHGLQLNPDDAARMVGAAVGVLTDALDDARTCDQAELVSGWMAAVLRDARALGANVDQMCAWTDLAPATVKHLLDRETPS